MCIIRVMKKYGIIIALLIGWLPFLSAGTRLFPDEYHYLSVWGGVGYQTLLNNSNTIKPGPGVAPEIGIGYRYYRNGFILQAGLEGEFAYLTNKLDGVDLKLDMVDTEGDEFIMHAAITDGKDKITAINLNIPILLGCEYKSFYFLAGAKIGINLYGSTYTQSKLATKGEYERYIDWFENMPNHEYENNQIVKSDTYKMKFNIPSVMAHVEIGGRLDRLFPVREQANLLQHKYRCYLAVFADYGLLNVHENKSVGSNLAYTQTAGEPLRFSVVPSMVSEQMLNKKVNPLAVGVKFTFLWELPVKKKCVMCHE